MPCPARPTVHNNYIQAEGTESSRGMSRAAKHAGR